MNRPSRAIGRVKTALVFGHGGPSPAFITTVTARKQCRVPEELAFRGQVVFRHEVTEHIHQTILPLVHRVMEGLGLEPCGFELSVTNLGAASTLDVGLEVSGFSADAAVALAMLSAALALPVPQDIVVTGHMASPDGALRPVKSVPAKLAAAARQNGIQRFACPSVDSDLSIQQLAPEEATRAAEAMATARDDLHVVSVSDVCELVAATADDESVVRAALRSGFFGCAIDGVSQDDPIDRAVRFLATRHEERFLETLEATLLGDRVDDAHALLCLRYRFHNHREQYPERFGRQLLQLVHSLPPAIRRIKKLFPLLPLGPCLRLCSFASPGDQEEVQCLLDASRGRVDVRAVRTEGEGTGASASTSASTVDAVVSEIRVGALASKVCRPIDSARAAYILPEVTTDSYDEFHETIQGFYVALLRRMDSAFPSDGTEGVASDAHALAERAFAKQGGFDAAWAEARHGTKGGLRFVLDAMTEQLKVEQQAKRVSRVLKGAIDPLDWDERVAFVTALLERLSPHLPEDIREQSPERFARHYEAIAQAYVQSLDRVSELLHRL